MRVGGHQQLKFQRHLQCALPMEVVLLTLNHEGVCTSMELHVSVFTFMKVNTVYFHESLNGSKYGLFS